MAGNCSSKEREKKTQQKMWVWVERARARECDQTKKEKKYFVNSLANLESDKRKIKHKWTKEREERERGEH